jgi:DNA (cytosine-5)-methyltransferase 1
MRYLSVCSGIEAASVAWGPLGWQAVAFSEIEPFPCAVLAHHYPDVPNLGDMTTIAQRILNGEVEAPDVLAGGTPCQAFSVAGLRKSLADERGNLTLKFAEIADAIDFVRVRAGRPPAIVFWENVPGVLSTKDNAFGCFLGALAGEDCELKPPGKRWADAGCVFGPQRAIAWRVLDAQYFGLAQRRRRVFLVASARDGFDPAKVLFEFEGVRRDSPPRREARQVAPTIPARSSGGGGLGTDFDCDGGLIHADPIARCITTGEAKRQDWETCNFVAHTLRADGFDASEDGTGRGTPLVPVGVTIHGTDPTVQKVASYDELAQCLRARTPGNIDNSSTTVVQQPVSYAIQAGALRTNPLSGPDGVGVQADLAYTLEARAEVQAVAFAENSRAELRLEGGDGSRCGAISTGGGKAGQGVPMVATAMQVRRLTPRECERLMGFPDDYTLVPLPLKGRQPRVRWASDSARYKALGNSWAVPVVRWIGERINTAVEQIKHERKAA